MGGLCLVTTLKAKLNVTLAKDNKAKTKTDQ